MPEAAADKTQSQAMPPGATPAGTGDGAMIRASDTLRWTGALLVCAMAATLLSMMNSDPVRAGGYFVIVCLYALVGVAALSDAALRKIPNRFSYTAFVLALVLMMAVAPLCEVMDWRGALSWIGAAYDPWGGIAFESLKGLGLCLAIGLVSFAAGGLGGGDVKVLATVGILAGWGLSVSILLNTLLVAAVVSVLNLLMGGAPIRALQALVLKLYRFVYGRDGQEATPFQLREAPFCFSLLIGLLLLPYANAHAIIGMWLARSTGALP